MEKVIKLYNYKNGIDDTPFPSDNEQVVIFAFEYNASRMGAAPSINAVVKHRLCLDNLWNEKVYALFNGEKYFVMNTPSSKKDNLDERYEHDVQLLSERDVLNHVYFIDSAIEGGDTNVSNSTKFQFVGDIKQFISRLNSSLRRRQLPYIAILDEGVLSESKPISFENKYISEALQEAFNVWNIPYYFQNRTIHFGYKENTITTPIKYGPEEALLSISKTNANYKVINRITGVGSESNIPYYYPNDSDNRAEIEASGKTWITPSQRLMPSIYRKSLGRERFYNAKNNTYPTPEGGFYNFENEYSEEKQLEDIVEFSEIKPTIEGMTNSQGLRMDMFLEFAYDTLDDDSYNEEKGEYTHSYFFAKLRKLDGEYGFNIFDKANEKQTMQISMVTGVCGSCVFEIGVGQETNKNIVQVDEQGNLLRDEQGNVIREGKPQDRQNDTTKYEVWIALKKDENTYPTFKPMPNVTANLRPSIEDNFVILGITLPNSYILSAEKKLDDSIIKYMWMNNVEKFNFSQRFSRIYFTEHPEVLEQINENARILIEYNGKQHALYIDNFTYKVDEKSPLPEIEVNLVDTLTIGKNSLQNELDKVKQDILSSIGGGDFLKQGLKYFIRKDTVDQTNFLLKFGNFIDSLVNGTGTGIFPNGRIQTRRLEVSGSMTVLDLVINELHAMAGEYNFSDFGKIESVEMVAEGTYKLKMQKELPKDFTPFEKDDILYSIINNLRIGGTDYYTSWFKVLSKDMSDNSIIVRLYDDGDVPDKHNYPPMAGYNVTRRGNERLPNPNEINPRSQSWLLSSSEGRMMFLANVYTPKLMDMNYSLVLGKLPNLKVIEELGLTGDVGLYAQTVVCEKLHRIDWNGDVVCEKVDRGEWSREVAENPLKPYRYIAREKTSEKETKYTLLEQHVVYHNGYKWGCTHDMTTLEPVWNSQHWTILEGDKTYHINFESTNGWSFFYSDVDTIVKAIVMYGSLDISNEIFGMAGVSISWTRDTGHVESDNTWNMNHLNATREIHLSANDMGDGWGFSYRKVSFICTIELLNNNKRTIFENRINIKM